MKAATRPPASPSTLRLLWVDPAGAPAKDHAVGSLADALRPGDLLVLNDAATLPASLAGRTASGETIEVRLAGEREDGTFAAVLFGAGDWRRRTEDRPVPPMLAPGETVSLAGGLVAAVRAVSDASPRLVTLCFDREGAAFWHALYAAGRPVQYSYLERELSLWDVQTLYAGRPWAVEPPSAGLGLSAALLDDLRRRGVRIAAVTHAAGLSSTGDPAIDALLPLPERYEVPGSTVRAVEATRAAGGRVVAAGTTVVRALEGSAADHGGRLFAGRGVTSYRLAPGRAPRVVDGLLTGVHEPGTSHFELLGAFAPRAVLHAAYRAAEEAGYRGHEFGDAWLILAA